MNNTSRSPRAKCLFAFQAAIILVFGLSMTTHAQTPKDHLVRIALDGGWTIKTGKPLDTYPSFYKDYLETVKQGFSWGAGATLNINNLFCIGAYYDFFRKNGKQTVAFSYSNGQPYDFDLDNTYTLDFLAFSMGIQKSHGKNRYMLQYLIGFMDYREDGNYTPFLNWSPNYAVGHCLGHGVLVNYDYMIEKHFAIGVELSYCIGSVSKLNHQGHLMFSDPNSTLLTVVSQLDEPIKLHRLSPKVGLRYYF